MSRSHRAHMTPRRRANRGPKHREGDPRDLKTEKQRRPNVRARLRKDYR